jgi:hypothetical protein
VCSWYLNVDLQLWITTPFFVLIGVNYPRCDTQLHNPHETDEGLRESKTLPTSANCTLTRRLIVLVMCRVAYGVATGAIVASICYTAYKAVRLNLSMNVLDTPEYLAYEVTCTQP